MQNSIVIQNSLSVKHQKLGGGWTLELLNTLNTEFLLQYHIYIF